MTRLTYEKVINAPAGIVWKILWDEKTYPEWTKSFTPDSRMQSDWKVGGRTYFTDGDQNGMISTISELNEPHKIVFEHLGELKKGVEYINSNKEKKIDNPLEIYALIEKDGITHLQVGVDSMDEYIPMMDEGFTKGLEKVKELAEY